MKDSAARLASLPPSVAELLRRVLERASVTEGDDEALDAAMAELMAAVGLSASAVRYLERPIPLASALTPEQRAVAEVLADHPEVPRGQWPLYWTPWLCRRWLGLEPGGVLFEEIELEVEGRRVRWPRVHALRHWVVAGEDERAAALVRALPLPARVEALVGLGSAEHDLESLAFSEALTETTLALVSADVGGGAWAGPLADWVLAREEPPSDEIAMLVFAALVATGVAIEPRHDALLRLAWGDFAELGHRGLAAIPEERREAAMLGAIAKARFSSHRIRIGLTYLSQLPYPGVARRVLAELEHADDPKKVLATLEKIGGRHPAIAEVVAAAKQALPAIPELTVASVLRPVTLDALDDVHRRQLEIASKLYSGTKEAAEEILARGDDDEDGEQIHPSFLELRTIVGADGRPRYDAWLYMVDSGTIFAAGTERVVAEVIQFGVETSDPVLRLALPAVLGSINGVKRKRTAKAAKEEPAKKKTAAKKTAAKKTAAKKTAAKKTAAKKTAAKKTAAKKTAAKKTAAKKTAAKKTATKKTATKKTATKPKARR